jgi:hypothetical protein
MEVSFLLRCRPCRHPRTVTSSLQFQHTMRPLSVLLAPRRLFSWLTLQSWSWKQYILPKHRHTTRLYGDVWSFEYPGCLCSRCCPFKGLMIPQGPYRYRPSLYPYLFLPRPIHFLPWRNMYKFLETVDKHLRVMSHKTMLFMVTLILIALIQILSETVALPYRLIMKHRPCIDHDLLVLPRWFYIGFQREEIYVKIIGKLAAKLITSSDPVRISDTMTGGGKREQMTSFNRNKFTTFKTNQ